MNKKWSLLVLLVIIIPSAVYAFSWGSLFSSSSQKTTTRDAALLTEVEKKVADRKYNDWDNATSKKDIKLLAGNQDNFIFSEAELNYFVAKSLAKEKNPQVNNIKIILNDGSVNISGYSFFSPFKGDVSLEGKIVSDGVKLRIELTKFFYRGWSLPTFFAASIVNRYTPDLFNFLYSYPNYSSLAVVIKDKKLELRYVK